MSNNPHSEDPENEHFVLISGNIDNFFGNSNKPNLHRNADEIYDLSSLPQDTHKPLINESEANFIKTNNEIMHSDPFVDSYRNLKEIKEETKQNSIENIAEVEKLENESKNDAKSFAKHVIKTPSLSFTAKTELQSPPKMENPKKIESAHDSPINKFDFQPIIKTLQKTADNLDKYMKNNETVKKEEEKRKSSNEIKSPQTPSQEKSNQLNADQLPKEELKVLKKKKTKKSEKSPKIEDSNKETPAENNDQHVEEHKETPQADNEAIENVENEENKIKKKREKHSKKKKKTKKDKNKENEGPPIISVGIPMSSNDAFDRSFNESPDLLIKFIS